MAHVSFTNALPWWGVLLIAVVTGVIAWLAYANSAVRRPRRDALIALRFVTLAALVVFLMLYLWIFGDNVEDRLGHFGYLIFYLAAGAAAAIGQVIVSPDSTIPMIGASGAIAAVMGAYFVLYPHSRVLTVVFLLFFMDMIEIPAIFFLGVWFVKELFSGVGSLGAQSMSGGVAFWAHIVGFAVGATTGLVWRVREPPQKTYWM